MLELMILLKAILQVNSDVIIFDSGLTTEFSPTTYYSSGDEKTSTISFSGTFANIPKVILVSEKWDQGYDGAQYYVQTQSITTISFQIYLKCVSGHFQTLVYHWYAIDSQLIEVLDQINVVQYTVQPIPHTNPSATSGFISILCAGYSGLYDFEVQISSITTTDVNILITNPSNLNGNLKTITYQIILVVPEIYNLIDTITATTTYTSPDIPVKPYSLFMVPQSYVKRQNLGHNIRFEVIYSTLDPIKYVRQSFSGSDYVINTHKQIQLFYLTKPLKCKKNRISLMFNPALTETHLPMLQVAENSLAYNTIGTFSSLFGQSIDKFTMKIQVFCPIGKKYSSTFLICPDCSSPDQMDTYYHSCNGNVNQITYYPIFQSIKQKSEKINIEVTQTSIRVTQVMHNKVVTDQVLLYIQQLDL